MFSRESWCLVSISRRRNARFALPPRTPMVRSDDNIFLKNFGKMHNVWNLGLELQDSSLGLRVFDKVSVSSRNFNQISVSVSKVTVSNASLYTAALHLLCRSFKCGSLGCSGLLWWVAVQKRLKTTNRVHPPPTFLFKWTFRFQKTVVTCKSSENLPIAIVKPMLSPYSL